jgi:hypothetical protein
MTGTVFDEKPQWLTSTIRTNVTLPKDFSFNGLAIIENDAHVRNFLPFWNGLLGIRFFGPCGRFLCGLAASLGLRGRDCFGASANVCRHSAWYAA